MPEEGQTTRWTIPQEPVTKEPMYSINKSNIKVPVDIQGVLEIYETLYAASGLAVQTITMDKQGYGFVQALAKSLTPGELHTFTLDFSFDNVNWYNEYTSGVAELSINRTLSSTAKFWRLSSNNNGGAAHNVDLILGATPSS